MDDTEDAWIAPRADFAEDAPRDAVDTGFMQRGGEMGARMRAQDWRAAGLGDPAGWPQSLKTAIRIVLSSRFAMWMLWGPELTFFCNDAYKPTLGIKETWALGSRSDRVWEEIWPEIGPRIRQVLEAGEATWDEDLFLLLERRGFPEETYHTFSYSPLTDNAGAIAGMLCVVTEETERVVGERRLRLLGGLAARLATSQSRSGVFEAFAASLAEAPQDVPAALLYLFDPDGQGARRACAAGIPADAPGAPAILSRQMAEAWPLWEATAADGTRTLVNLAGRLGTLPAGPSGRVPDRALLLPIAGQGEAAPIGVAVLALSPIRPLDSGYRGFLDLLVGQVAAGIASADAYEAERRRAEALAELDRARTVFFSNVSHEFRTPLTLMLSPLEEILGRDGLATEDADLLNLAHRNGLRLLRLVNGLLDFARVEAGRATVRFEPTDLAAVTEALAGNFRSLCEQAGLALVVACPSLDEPVHVDRDMWEKVVLNLLSNAFKFTFAGEIRVSLRRDAGHAVMEVADTGIGIAAEELPRLFERFHRVEGARGRTFEGSGIGLALVQELVQLQHGTIAAESEPGRGSLFRVALPLGRAHVPAEPVAPAAPETSTAVRAAAFVEEARRWLDPAPDEAGLGVDDLRDLLPAGGAGAPALRSERILLADDNADMREHVRRLLARQGYAVEAVADGQAALDAARIRAPDLVLTDVMMPRLDGFGLLAAIRAEPALRELPVIILSARAGDEAKVEGLDAGADDYLVKPFSARELLARVGTNIQLASVRREASDALRSLNASLASEVAERTAERDRVWRNSRDLLAVIGADGIFRAVNPAWTPILGYEPTEIEGRSFRDFIWPEDAAITAAALGQAVTQRDLTSFENRYTHRDGSPRWLSWHTSREGDLVYAYGREITAEKDQAEALRLTEEALRQSQKLEAIGQLTGGVAHDFNNLLTIIRSSVDFLRRPNLPEERRTRYLEAVSDTVDRAAKLTSQLLAFARRQALKPETFEVGVILRAIADMIDTVTGARVRVETRLPEARCYVHADLSQFETALVNMAVNARDAMDGEGALTLGLEAGMPLPTIRGHGGGPGPFVAVSLTDTGSGIPPEVIDRIFEPFFTTKEVGKGTGLGLSQVFGFAKQSGGNVAVSVGEAGGTTFTLYLPEVPDGPVLESEAEAERPAPAGNGRRVLVVEDNVEVGRFATQTLQDLGYVTTWTANAAEALARLEADPGGFDVVFSDVVMPGMNGVDLGREIRRRRPGLPVVLASGYSHVLAEEGHHGFELLHKPYSVDELSRILRQVTRRRRTRG